LIAMDCASLTYIIAEKMIVRKTLIIRFIKTVFWFSKDASVEESTTKCKEYSTLYNLFLIIF
jgi:hypothetical protein